MLKNKHLSCADGTPAPSFAARSPRNGLLGAFAMPQLDIDVLDTKYLHEHGQKAILETQLLVHGACHNASQKHVLNHAERLRHAFREKIGRHMRKVVLLPPGAPLQKSEN